MVNAPERVRGNTGQAPTASAPLLTPVLWVAQASAGVLLALGRGELDTLSRVEVCPMSWGLSYPRPSLAGAPGVAGLWPGLRPSGHRSLKED